MLKILYYLNLKIKLDGVACDINFDSNDHVKCKFASSLIQPVSVTNLFAFEVVQKMPNFPTLRIMVKLELMHLRFQHRITK